MPPKRSPPGSNSNSSDGKKKIKKKKKTSPPALADGLIRVQAKERDVLMGRGKRVSEWPGNIKFRQVVGRFRTEYQAAPNHQKIVVASTVLDEIHGMGGRFLLQLPDKEWSVIAPDAALEKCCQALREKKWSDPPSACPFADPAPILPRPPVKRRLEHDDTKTTKGITKTAAASAATGDKKGKKRTSSPSSAKNNKRTKKAAVDYSTDKPSRKTGRTPKSKPRRDEEDMAEEDESDDEDEPISIEKPTTVASPKDDEESDDDEDIKDASDSSSFDEESLLSLKERQQQNLPTIVSSATGVMERTRSLLEDEMMSRLELFIERTGHAAVPSCFADDEALADWCIAQRQVYREVVLTEYRTATSNEQACLERLNSIGFVWDYEAWHWNRQYETTLHATQISDATCRTWLLDQRVQLLAGNPTVTAQRKQKLLNLVV